MKLLIDPIMLPGQPQHGGFKHAFNRYYTGTASSSSTNISLILLHCLVTHKESWEPVLERLFDLQLASTCKGRVTEAWSMDCPSHGEAAAHNETLLLSRSQGVNAYDWAHGLRELLASGLVKNTTVVGVGHSGGATALLLSTLGLSPAQLPFSSFIFVEPALMTEFTMQQSLTGNSTRRATFEYLLRACKTRTDVWPSRESALQWLATHDPWKRWDNRILRSYLRYGLRELPTAAYPDQKEGVTLACTREQEAMCYTCLQDGVDSLERLAFVCAAIPVHCIFGDRIDFVPEDIRKATVDESTGRKMASITTIPGAGHLIAQEKPDEVADAMWTILGSSPRRESRL
ncbi:hypothetical protein EIP91_000423 [Steccherinum ochraceum]|uniref:AB hydrolase-1 domain-containing protein n=1 Tax=Steccherinum ochraceum TaxID=92696 RepID=A0A4R0RIA6_9APHY|nr:hypothetical protein EIP91_000423 [Steccherinum ochraceum]